MIDFGSDGHAVEIHIPAGEYGVAGEIAIAPVAPASVKITSSGGSATLLHRNAGTPLFAIGKENFDAPGKAAIEDLIIVGLPTRSP